MDADEFRRKVRAAWSLLQEELDLGRSVSSLFSLEVDDEFNSVALDPESSYKDIYLKAVSRSYYNFLLEDYSIYQFSWQSESNWRFAYLPNPWISGVPGAAEMVRQWEGLEGLGAYDEEEVAALIGELPYYGSIPPIRLEYATHQYKELAHPAAHLHIGRHTENRWALSKHLTPLSFVMFICKMYYNDLWAPRSSYHGEEVEACLDRRLIQELEHARRVHDFSESERRSVHVSAR